ncbi:MAG TPA: hypothetical protein VMU08_08040, partial [Rhizomicrobium sp.]|nr:hypothetical protein [Rhizomicrobium sp.]
GKAYKLKKPIMLPYLDFSSVEKREAMCRAELALNRRMAESVYLDVVPLCATPAGLRLAGEGPIVDWVVVMRRLDAELMLEAAILNRRAEVQHLEALAQALTHFYRRAPPVFATPGQYLGKWRRLVLANRQGLLHPQLGMPTGPVLEICALQRRFLDRFATVLVRRLQEGRVVDGHGDLRPEHIWLGRPLAVIDCLEFNRDFRAVDPFDELASLAIECERLGDAKVGRWILRRLARMLPAPPPAEILAFYRCYRATLRARLSAVHLLEEKPRTPQKWRPLALRYLEIAGREAAVLRRALSRRATRRDVHRG